MPTFRRANRAKCACMSGMTAPEAVPAAEQHHHGTISGFLHALPHLLKSPTKV